jgi:integrase
MKAHAMWNDKQVKAFATKDKSYFVVEKSSQRGLGRLALEVLPNGNRYFYFQYFNKGKRVYVTIGKYKRSAADTGHTLSEARDTLRNYSDILKQGIDVKFHLEERERKKVRESKKKDIAETSLQNVLDDYLAEKELKPGTIADYKKAINESFSDYLEKPITDVTREVVLSQYRKRVKKSVARTNNAMRVFRALYNYHRAITRQDDGTYLLPDNPVSILSDAKVTKKVKRRKEYIPKDKLKAWFNAVLSLDDSKFASGSTVRDYFLFILLTGTRREEAKSLPIAEVDMESGTFRLTDTKNNEVVVLPMSDYVGKLIKKRLKKVDGNYVFPGGKQGFPLHSFKRPMDHIRKEAGIDFTLHDLRRTFITVAESMDISSYTIKRLVNHKIDDSNDVTAGYVAVDIDRMRAATQRVTDQVLFYAGIKKSPAKVVSLKMKRA